MLRTDAPSWRAATAAGDFGRLKERRPWPCRRSEALRRSTAAARERAWCAVLVPVDEQIRDVQAKRKAS